MVCWLSLGFTAPVWAQDTEPVAPEVAEIQAQIAEAELSADANQEELQALRALLDQGALLVDPYVGLEQRQAAAEALAISPDPKAIAFLNAASRSKLFGVRNAVIKVAHKWGDAAVPLLAERVVRDAYFPANQSAALAGLAAVGSDVAGMALYAIATDKKMNSKTIEVARATLETHFAEFLKTKGGAPKAVGDLGGRVLGVGASAITGGILLNAVGTWGKTEAGRTVGALGGAAIGAGTAEFYLRDNPVSEGQGLRYSSNVVWGMVGAGLTNDALDVRNDNMRALTRVVGVSGGAYSGFQAMAGNPSVGNVMETNATGVMGMMLAGTIHEVADAGGDSGSASLLLGASAGLGVGVWVQDPWNPSASQAVFAGVVGLESHAVGAMSEELFGIDSRWTEDGLLTGQLGFVGGLVGAHHLDPSLNTSALMGHYALLGHLAGSSVGDFAPKYRGSNTDARFIMGAGVLGMVGGGLASRTLEPSLGDLGATALGGFVASANTGAIGFKMISEDIVSEDTMTGTLKLVFTGVTGGLLATTGSMDLDPDLTIFMATGAGWGAYYGSLTQLVIPQDLAIEDAALVTTGLMDLGIAGAAYFGSKEGGIDPKDTFLPQLFGVAGGTLGSLTVMLANSDEQLIAGGALIGSTVGLGAGAVLAPKLSKKRGAKAAATKLKRGFDLPGDWTVIALPSVNPDGTMGGSFQVQGLGW
jgi:hypothetical protein